jgi:leucyl aminopeptidase (aminopeptidase T)
MSDLERAVHAVIHDCMGVKEGEEVLVIANPSTLGMAERLRAEAGRAGADGVLALMADRPTDGAEPPAVLAAAMAKANVVLAPTVKSLSHTAARREANEAGVRVATLPQVTEENLARVMSADMDALSARCHAVARILDQGSEAHLTCANGSDLRLSLEGRTGTPDDGNLTAPGAFGNLPCGEGFISPLEGATEGTLVVDGTITSIGIPEQPTTLTVEGGHLRDATGDAGKALMEALTAHGEDGTNVAELGIGTNEKAIPSGNLIEDEKILGTAHVAFGANAAIGGTVQVPIHIDCVVMKPDLAIDGEPLIRAGELLV